MTIGNRLLTAALLTAALTVASGCIHAPAVSDAGSPSSLSSETTPAPGISRAGTGQVKAVGTLIYERRRKRFALVNAGPLVPLTGKERIVAVVREGRTNEEDLIGLIGGYVELSGPSVESTQLAFPKLQVESIRIISLATERKPLPK